MLEAVAGILGIGLLAVIVAAHAAMRQPRGTSTVRRARYSDVDPAIADAASRAERLRQAAAAIANDAHLTPEERRFTEAVVREQIASRGVLPGFFQQEEREKQLRDHVAESLEDRSTGPSWRAALRLGVMGDFTVAHAEQATTEPLTAEEATALAPVSEASLEHALALLFLRLGPPPEPIENDYVPASNGDGGAQQ
jgi:hypothetical protein